MKRIVGLIVIVLFAGNTFAQSINQSDIPAVVLNSFQIKYPNADDMSWKLAKGNYQVDYKVNDKLHKLIMDFKGNTLRHSQDLYMSEVPKAVQKTIGTRLAYFDMHDADKHEEGGKINYEIRFKQDGKNHYFWISEKGKLLKYRKELKNNEIPLPMVNLINKQYGTLDMGHSKYVEEGGTIVYIIRGEINDKDHVFTIDDKLKMVKHEQDLRDNEIPDAIHNAMNKSYDGYDIRDADLMEENGTVVYVLKIKKSRKQIYVSFNKDGKVLDVK